VRVKATGDERTHLEMRTGSATSNPYLLASATLAAGLLGVKARSKLRAQRHDIPSEENAALPPLPPSLDAALDALEADGEMRAMLGEDFIKVFTAVKRFELARLHSHITDWETNEYLELY
jgi:glutamine synthetase